MPNEEDNELPIEVSAALELAEPAEPSPELKRGIASLRGVKRAVYMRRSLLKVLSMAPEELERFDPPNGFMALAKALVTAHLHKNGATIIAIWREVRTTLGERSEGPNGRARETHQHSVIVDLPTTDVPISKPDKNKN